MKNECRCTGREHREKVQRVEITERVKDEREMGVSEGGRERKREVRRR